MKRETAFKTVREHCLAKECVSEEYPWGEVVWKTGGRIFAIGSLGHNAFTVKASRADQDVLVLHPAVEAARYVGRFGWVTVTVTCKELLALVLDLIDESYAALVKKRNPKRTSRPHASRPRRGAPPAGWK